MHDVDIGGQLAIQAANTILSDVRIASDLAIGAVNEVLLGLEDLLSLAKHDLEVYRSSSTPMLQQYAFILCVYYFYINILCSFFFRLTNAFTNRLKTLEYLAFSAAKVALELAYKVLNDILDASSSVFTGINHAAWKAHYLLNAKEISLIPVDITSISLKASLRDLVVHHKMFDATIRYILHFCFFFILLFLLIKIKGKNIWS